MDEESLLTSLSCRVDRRVEKTEDGFPHGR